ncbi:MAG: hypothetical protein KBD36_05905 [Alphaproteobacteria bacterium]|nr:hypothetical protein [Alphaproteobacteria bacterium]
MNQNEQDIQRFIQIRDEINEEIKKIGPNVIQLQEATTALLSHVDVFKELSKTAQEHMRIAIQGAAQDMAHSASEAFSTKIESQVQEILTTLDQSVQYAKRTLDSSRGTKYRNLRSLSILGCLLCGISGTGLGYFYAKRNPCSLPPDLMKMYALGYEYKAAHSKMSGQEKQKMEKLMKRK